MVNTHNSIVRTRPPLAAGAQASTQDIDDFFSKNNSFDDGSVYTPVAKADLKGTARTIFQHLEKKGQGDYAPAAYTAKVNGHPTVFVYLGLEEENFLYGCAPSTDKAPQGRLLASAIFGDGDPSWDKTPTMP